jgi:hypothetical protein
MGTSGSDVETLYSSNERDKIANYCEKDVLSTTLLLLKYFVYTGKTSSFLDSYNHLKDNFRERHQDFFDKQDQLNLRK